MTNVVMQRPSSVTTRATAAHAGQKERTDIMASLGGITMRTRLGAILLAAGSVLAVGATAAAQAAPSISIVDQPPIAAGAQITLQGANWSCVADISVTLDGATSTVGALDINMPAGTWSIDLTAPATPGDYTITAFSATEGGGSSGGCQNSASTTLTVAPPDTTAPATTTTTTTTTTVAPTTTTTVAPTTTPTTVVSTTSAPTTVEQESATTTTTPADPPTSQALATRLPATGVETDLVPYALVTLASGALLVLVTRRRPA